MSKGGSQTITQTPDRATQQYVDQMRRAALGYTGLGGPGGAAAPQGGNPFLNRIGLGGGLGFTGGTAVPPIPEVDPALRGALDQYQQYAQLGNLGIGALSGGENPFMNTYLSALNPVFDQLRQQSLEAVGERATQAGAFGGSRQGVAQGQALSDIANQQAGFNYQAFNDSMMRALQAANLGFAGTQGQTNIGQYLTEYPQAYAARQLGILGQGIGPYGMTQTVPTSGSPLTGLLGTGLAVAGAFPGLIPGLALSSLGPGMGGTI